MSAIRSTPGPFRVYVGLVSTGYLAPNAIDRVVQDGIAFCGLSNALHKLRSDSRLLIKPDVLVADQKVAPHAYTNPEVLRAVVTQLQGLSRGARVTVLGSTLPELSASRVLARAHGGSETFRKHGYYTLESLFPGILDVLPQDEAPAYRYQLSKDQVSGPTPDHAELLANARVHNELLAPREYYDTDFSIYCPKLKSNVLAQGFSGAIRLGDPVYRGIDADRHVCDWLEVCNPNLVVSDGIIAAVGGNEITQRGHELGVVLVANNALAHDWVAAQILNLDPLKIDHLRIAMARGWGPQSGTQIELGGAGAEGVRNLAQKSRFWDLGYLPVHEFGKKYESENPGLAFPLEIISGSPYRTAGAQGMLLNWLYLAYDTPALRSRIAKWPRSSAVIGYTKSYPSRYLAYAIGDSACQAIDHLTSSSRRLFRTKRFELLNVQLKNRRRHLIVKIAGSPPRLNDLSWGFWLGSLGRISVRTRSLALLADRIAAFFRGRTNPGAAKAHSPLVMTSRMPQNSWWALRPLRPNPPPARGAVSTQVSVL